MTLSKPSWSGAAVRVVVALALVAVVAAVIVWERRVAPAPDAGRAGVHEPLELSAAADSAGALRVTWRPDPRADAYELELLDEKLAVLATEGPLSAASCVLAFDRVPATARWCRVVALRGGERLGESGRLELWVR